MLTIWGTPVLAEVSDILDLVQLELATAGVDVFRSKNKTGRNIMVTCPFHEGKDGIKGSERKPSCGVTATVTYSNDGKREFAPGTVHCFTCGYTADLVEFISNLHGYQDRGMFGYKWISARYAAVSVERRQPLKLETRSDIATREAQANAVTFVTEDELASYRFLHPYMYHRKLSDKVINYFDVGYDQVKNALTFPVHDLQGNVLFVQRRAIEGKSFLNEDSIQRGSAIYGLYHVYKNLSWVKRVTICESILDALTCWVYGEAAVALLSADPTEKQINLLKGLPVRNYISGLDNDLAGRKGTEKLKRHLGDYKILQKIVWPNGVKDINEMTEEQFLNRDHGTL